MCTGGDCSGCCERTLELTACSDAGPRLTAFPRGRPAASGRDDRDLVAEELVDTERTYNRDLDVIVKVVLAEGVTR